MDSEEAIKQVDAATEAFIAALPKAHEIAYFHISNLPDAPYRASKTTLGEMARDILMVSVICAAFGWLFWLLLK